VQGIEWVGVIIQRSDGRLEGWEVPGARVDISGGMTIDMFSRVVTSRDITITIRGTAHKTHRMPRPPDLRHVSIEGRAVIDAVVESEVSGDGDSSEDSGEVEGE